MEKLKMPQEAEYVLEAVRNELGATILNVRDRAGKVINTITENVGPIMQKALLMGMIFIAGLGPVSCTLAPGSEIGGGGKPPIINPPPPGKPKTGAELLDQWRLNGTGIDPIEISFVENFPVITSVWDGMAMLSGTIEKLAKESYDMEGNLRVLKSIIKDSKPGEKDEGKYINLPDETFIDGLAEYFDATYHDKGGTHAGMAIMAGMPIKEGVDRALYNNYARTYIGMNLFIGQENSKEDYTTKFNTNGTDIYNLSIADNFQRIKDAGGESFEPTGPYDMDAVRDAALALVPEDNRRLAEDAFTHAGNIMKFLGLVNRVTNAGFARRLDEGALDTLRFYGFLANEDTLRGRGILYGGAFKSTEIQSEAQPEDEITK